MRVDVAALVTSLVAETQQVSAHGISIEMIERQAKSIGLPLLRVPLPNGPSNDVYLRAFSDALEPLRTEGVATVAFGDIFLEDLRLWRERSFREIGFESIFPLWGESTSALAGEFFDRGFCAVVCAVNGAFLERDHLARLYDRLFVQRLPERVDCCGENGEFHTFTFEGPIFGEPVRYAAGTTTYKPVMHGSPVSGHWFLELKPASESPGACPLCGSENQCAVVAGASLCWCYTERIPQTVRDRIPPYARDVACVCPRCALSAVESSAELK